MICENAIIMAGGKSSRMGEDKALLPFGNFDTLIQFQYEKLKRLFPKVYISTKESKFDFDSSLIYDRYEESSPLVALISILETIQAESVFVLSVDVPFVGKEIIDTLLTHHVQGIDVTIAQCPNGDEHPLCGFYEKSILAVANAQYKKGNHKLRDLLSLVNTQRVMFKDETPFMNLNHPEDYNAALKLSLSGALT